MCLYCYVKVLSTSYTRGPFSSRDISIACKDSGVSQGSKEEDHLGVTVDALIL